MPISAIDGYPATHWEEVLSIIKSCAHDENFDTKLVSEDDEVGIIQKRIVQNLYSHEVVVCDVSGKNPNVMFELGMRLAFDKPTIVLKDDQTDYSFDTSPLEHIPYPRDLRFGKIINFKKALRSKLKAALSGSNKHSFLKSFGEFQTVKLESTEIPAEKYVMDSISEIKSAIGMLRRETRLQFRELDVKNTRRLDEEKHTESTRERDEEFILQLIARLIDAKEAGKESKTFKEIYNTLPARLVPDLHKHLEVIDSDLAERLMNGYSQY